MNLQDVRAIRTVLADCFPRETVKRENPPDNQSVVNQLYQQMIQQSGPYHW